MLLNVEILRGPQWWKLWWGHRGAENSSGCQGLLDHVGTEVGLITCVWSRIGQTARHSTAMSRGTGCYSVPFQVVTANKKGDETTGRKEADERDIQHGHDEEREYVMRNAVH